MVSKKPDEHIHNRSDNAIRQGINTEDLLQDAESRYRYTAAVLKHETDSLSSSRPPQPFVALI